MANSVIGWALHEDDRLNTDVGALENDLIQHARRDLIPDDSIGPGRIELAIGPKCDAAWHSCDALSTRIHPGIEHAHQPARYGVILADSRDRPPIAEGKFTGNKEMAVRSDLHIERTERIVAHYE